MTDITWLCIRLDQTLRQAMACINKSCKGIALVLDEKGCLLYTITDGDLRRAVLHGLTLEMTIEEWAKECAEHGNTSPMTATMGTSRDELFGLMQEKRIQHLPLLDEKGRVKDLVSMNDLFLPSGGILNAVVMAGGFGTRLHPMTMEVPKPMLPLGDRPLMEHIVNQLHSSGVKQVSITTHYKSEAIIRHFGDGRDFGLKIDYVKEDHPLGTAGALGLIEPWDTSLLVINGDVLTRLNCQSMLAFHQENLAVMTVAIGQYEVQVPYGIVDTEGVAVSGLREKPKLQFFVNAGVYLLEPAVHKYCIPPRKLDMTDLILQLLKDKQNVVSFPISEYWLDIGQHEDYQKAQADFQREESS